jgi:adenylate cyclase
MTSLADSRECLERAVKADPGYATAHAALALARMDSLRPRALSTPEGKRVLESSVALARRAIELAPQSSAGHAAMLEARWLHGDLEQSLAAGERALSLTPNDPEVMAAVGYRYGLRGDWTKALPLLERAFAEDPDLPSRYRQVTSLHLYMTGRYDAALAEAKRMDLPDFVYTHVLQAIAAAKAGRQQQARAAIQRVVALEPRFAQTMSEDLQAQRVHPGLIRAIAEGLRAAGLEVLVRNGAEVEDDAA